MIIKEYSRFIDLIAHFQIIFRKKKKSDDFYQCSRQKIFKNQIESADYV